MKNDYRYLLLLGGALLLFIMVEIISPRPVNWTVTFSSRDTNPFGGYVVDSLMDHIFPGKRVINNNSTIYEISREYENYPNIFMLAGEINMDTLEAKSFLKMIANGAQGFVGVHSMGGSLADSLKIKIERPIGEIARRQASFEKGKKDSIRLNFIGQELKTSQGYQYNYLDAANYFSRLDSSRAQVIATNEKGQPVLIKYTYGRGQLLVSSTPLAFTNYYILWDNNHEYIAKSLSHLPVKDVVWSEYYQLGNMEAQTPLRFILRTPSLKWAFYLLITGLMLFIVFEAKRKQRIIPVRQPPANYTLEFIQTVANLFLREKDHKNIAGKKITYFKHHIFHKFRIALDEAGKEQIEKLANKSGFEFEQINSLLNFIRKLEGQSKIPAEELLALENRLDQFYRALK